MGLGKNPLVQIRLASGLVQSKPFAHKSVSLGAWAITVKKRALLPYVTRGGLDCINSSMVLVLPLSCPGLYNMLEVNVLLGVFQDYCCFELYLWVTRPGIMTGKQTNSTEKDPLQVSLG